MSTVTPATPVAVRSPNSSSSVPGGLERARRAAGVEGRPNPAVASKHPISQAHIEIQAAHA